MPDALEDPTVLKFTFAAAERTRTSIPKYNMGCHVGLTNTRTPLASVQAVSPATVDRGDTWWGVFCDFYLSIIITSTYRGPKGKRTPNRFTSCTQNPPDTEKHASLKQGGREPLP